MASQVSQQAKQTASSVLLQKIMYTLALRPWQEQFGLGLILLSMLMWFWVDRPATARIVELSAEIQQQRLIAKPSQVSQPDKLSEHDQLAALLPLANQANALIAEFLHIASQQGLPIDKVEYKAQPAQKGNFQALQILLPTKGQYVQIRQFINALLNVQPSLALNEIRFNRDDLSVEQVEANMVFMLYLQQK